MNIYFAEVFPFMQKIFPSVPPNAMKFFENTINGIFSGREKSGLKIPDMVNTLMEMREKCSTPDYKRLGITEVTVLAQALEFFLASYQGTLTTLTYLCYNLVINPEVNAKLMKEVDSALKKSKGKANFEAVSEMDYLTACISETLRISPSFFRPDRMCTKDWEFQGSFTFYSSAELYTFVEMFWASHKYFILNNKSN